MADDGNTAGAAGAEPRDNNEDDVQRVDGMTVTQLKDELRKCKLKVTVTKADLAARLMAALVLKGLHKEDDDDDDEPNDEEEDEQSEDGVSNDGGRNEARNRPKFIPTFKDIEESVDVFNGDDGKDVKLWIKEFEDMATL